MNSRIISIPWVNLTLLGVVKHMSMNKYNISITFGCFPMFSIAIDSRRTLYRFLGHLYTLPICLLISEIFLSTFELFFPVTVNKMCSYRKKGDTG